MPRWDKDGGRIVTSIFEAAAFQYTIRATCSCGHSAVFQPHALWWQFQRKGWPDKLAQARQRFRCLRCGRRSPRVETGSDAVTRDVYPLPPDVEWKRAVNRFRC